MDILNDTVDYTYDVYPNLPSQLEDDVPYVAMFTFALTALSVLAAAVAKFPFERRKDKTF